MKASELMTREPRAVRVGERLDAAARILWESDCGIAPVVDSEGALVGVLTDRDLCMAVFTQGRTLSELGATSVMSTAVRTCRPDDSVATVMTTMREAQVHRLPVVDARGVLVGIISTNDLVRAAHSRPAAFDTAMLVRCLAGIGAPRNAAAEGTEAQVRAPKLAAGESTSAKAVSAARGEAIANKPSAGRAAAASKTAAKPRAKRGKKA
jgi:CBS domain-containing protein